MASRKLIPGRRKIWLVYLSFISGFLVCLLVIYLLEERINRHLDRGGAKSEADIAAIFERMNLDDVTYQRTNEKDRLASCISQRYKLALQPTQKIIQLAFDATTNKNLDPLLVLAVIGVESHFNPLVISSAGALGLMQIMPDIHATELEQQGGAQAALDPRVNIPLGSNILWGFIKEGGSVESGLARFVGAGKDTSHPYVSEVLAVYEKNKICIGVPISKKTSSPISSNASLLRTHQSP